jgi:hypothetical protein
VCTTMCMNMLTHMLTCKTETQKMYISEVDTLRSNSVINLVIELRLLIIVLELFHDTDIFVALCYLHIYSNFCYAVLDNNHIMAFYFQY